MSSLLSETNPLSSPKAKNLLLHLNTFEPYNSKLQSNFFNYKHSCSPIKSPVNPSTIYFYHHLHWHSVLLIYSLLINTLVKINSKIKSTNSRSHKVLWKQFGISVNCLLILKAINSNKLGMGRKQKVLHKKNKKNWQKSCFQKWLLKWVFLKNVPVFCTVCRSFSSDNFSWPAGEKCPHSLCFIVEMLFWWREVFLKG